MTVKTIPGYDLRISPETNSVLDAMSSEERIECLTELERQFESQMQEAERSIDAARASARLSAVEVDLRTAIFEDDQAKSLEDGVSQSNSRIQANQAKISDLRSLILFCGEKKRNLST